MRPGAARGRHVDPSVNSKNQARWIGDAACITVSVVAFSSVPLPAWRGSLTHHARVPAAPTRKHGSYVDDSASQAQASATNQAAVDGVRHLPSTARSGSADGAAKCSTVVAAGLLCSKDDADPVAPRQQSAGITSNTSTRPGTTVDRTPSARVRIGADSSNICAA